MANNNWYRLDNAGKLYPSIVNTRRSTVFRLSVKLKEFVDENRLQKALTITIKRFPYYKVNLKRGLFWYYFEESDHEPLIQPETYYPCMFLKYQRKKTFPFRVLYYNQYIHFEISHSIADGTSGMIFLKTLLVEYFKLKSISSSEITGILNTEEEADKGEWEDSFKRYYTKGVPSPDTSKRAVHFPFELTEKGKYLFLTGIVPVNEVKELSKAHACTVTMFITALYFMAIQDYVEQLQNYEKRKMTGRIVMNIPVDLRQMFPSKTMKNFFVSFTPTIDLRNGYYELDEIIEYLNSYMKMNNNRKLINKYIARNVRNERKVFVRLLPLWLKNIVMPFIYVRFGERGYTSSISNLGVVKLPDELKEHVEAFEFYPAPSEVNKIKMCMCAYDQQLRLSFGKMTQNTEIEKYFFRRLKKMGVQVKIETNTHHVKE